ncbi:MAG TPA: efflux RND transporter permease subunit [Syntrophales bacterium]|nr:efflux RND transporter permease subunit [Syntrophales bacterium]
MYRKLGAWLMEHRYTAIAFELLVTLFFLWQIKNTDISSRLSELLPYDHPYIKVHRQYEEQLGDPFKVFVMLKVKEGTIYTKETLEKVRQINEKMDFIPGVNHNQIYSIASRKVKKITVNSEGIFTEAFMEKVPTTKEELEKFRQTVQNSRNVFGTWISRDEKSVLFTAGFISGKSDYDVIFSKAREIVRTENDANHIVYVAGEPVLKGWINLYQRETYLIFGITCLAFLGLLYFYFRNLLGVLVHVPPIIIGMIWYLGFCGFMGFNIEPLTLVIPMLITARSLSHSVQFTERYFEIYEEVKDVKQACILTTASIVPPGILGIVSDGAGILLLAVAPIPIMQKLAYGCGFWALSIIFSGQLFTPVLISFFPPPKNIHDIIDREKGLTQKILGVIAKTGYGKAGVITFAVVVALYIFSGWQSFKVDIGDIHPGTPILWQDSDYNIAIREINRSFAGTDELYVIVERNDVRAVEQPEMIHLLDSFQRYMERSPAVAASQSIADFLPPIHRDIFGGYPKWKVLPETVNESAQLYSVLERGAAPGDYSLYYSEEGRSANVIIWYKDHMGDTIRGAISRVKNFMKERKEEIAKAKATFRLASGQMGMLAAINETIVEAQLLNAVLVIVMVFLMCAYTYRSFVAALILMIPLNLANCLTITIMNWLGIGLNINTLPVVSVGVGVGIDYGIYLLTRICEETQIAGRFSQSVVNFALKTTGKAIFFTATSMIFGVIFFYFLSSLRFQAEMGLLLAIIFFLNLIFALLLIPTIVFVFKPKFLTLTERLISK